VFSLSALLWNLVGSAFMSPDFSCLVGAAHGLFRFSWLVSLEMGELND
jgi:hypothetical protein